MTRGDLPATSPQQGAGASAGPGSGHDLVFTFYRETWTNAVRREMYMPGDLVLVNLLNRPAIRSAAVVSLGTDDPLSDPTGVANVAGSDR
jgi:hypothetical protein